MSILAIPNVFVNGSGPANIIDATQMNTNFTAVATAVNNIYPLQVIPLTGVQATFGGTAGYTFPPTGATAVSLSVLTSAGQSGVGLFVNSGGSGNLFQVGATLAISSAGVMQIFPTTNVTPLTLTMNASASTPGLLVNGAASITGNLLQVDLTSGGTHALLVNAAGVTVLGNVPLAGIPNGACISADTAGDMTINATAGKIVQLTAGAGAAGFAPVTGGAYTNASDAKLKKNVAPITGALATLAQLKPSSFDWIENDQPDFGFIAQEVEQVLPQIVRDHENSIKGVVYTGFTAYNTAAIIEMAERLKAAGVIGF